MLHVSPNQVSKVTASISFKIYIPVLHHSDRKVTGTNLYKCWQICHSDSSEQSDIEHNEPSWSGTQLWETSPDTYM